MEPLPTQTNPVGFTDDEVASLFEAPAPPPSYAKLPALTSPVCLPQINPGFDSPFIRAYSPELAGVGIGKEEWLAFCDGLNIALIGSPPLQVVDRVGMVIGFVPNEWCMIAGIAIQTVAQTGQHVISKTLTDKYLRKTNEDFFRPRGLVVRLVKTPALRPLITGSTDPPPSKLAAFGKAAGSTAQSVGLRLPFIRKAIVGFSSPAPRVSASSETDATGRRVAALQSEGVIAPLDFDVPPPKTPETVMDKASSLSIKLRNMKEGRKEGKADRARRVLEIRQSGGMAMGNASTTSGASAGGFSGALNYWDERKERKAERRAARDVRRGRPPRRSAMRKLRMKVDIEDRKEYLAGDSLLWLVVMNVADDAKIEHRELADEKGDYQEVDEEDWEEELDLEAEQEALFGDKE